MMRKVKFAVITILLIVMMLPSFVMAHSVSSSTYDRTTIGDYADKAVGGGTESILQNDSDLKAIYSNTKMSLKENDQLGKSFKEVAGIIFTIITYILLFGFGISVGLDLIFLLIPIARPLFDNWENTAGTTQRVGMIPGMMGPGPMGPFGTRPPMVGPMGGMGMMGRPPMGAPTGFMGAVKRKILKVSEEAITAISLKASGQLAENPVLWYLKNKAKEAIIISIALVIIVTGIAYKIGFNIGDVLYRIIGKFIY